MKKNGWFCFALTAVMVLPAWSADEGKVYKYVDKSGKVTYSQIPPTDGKPAEKMDAKPALQGRAGGGPAYSPYDEPRSYRYQESYRTSIIPAQPSVTAQEQRMAAVKAECERNRGTDCNNPATLQYLDSTSIPRRGRY